MRTLKVTATIILMLGFALAFQNCAKKAKGTRDSSSLADQQDFMPKEIIVRMKTADANNQLAMWAQANGLVSEVVSGTPEASNWNSSQMSHWSWAADKTPQEMMELLATTELAPMIDYAEPNYMYQEAAFQHLAEIPVDLRILTQAQAYSQASDLLKANLTPIQNNSFRPVVAVIDSGLQLTHESFVTTDALWVNTDEIANNQIDDDGNGYVDDVYGYNFKDKNNNLTDQTGHGTHCAGIVLGQGQNIFDLSMNAQSNPAQRSKIRIMPLKFIGPNGGATSDAINAIFYAINNGAHVLSNSWGGPSYSKALEDAIAAAYEQEILFVAAAGNSASNNDTTPAYPASYQVPNVISVAASDNVDALASFSNFGAASVDLAAPGVSIKSTYPNPTGDLGNYDGFNNLSGTSMATPMVSGVAALALYENSSLPAFQLKNIILDQADVSGSLSMRLKKPVRLNPYKAVSTAKTAVPTSTKPAFSRNVASASDEAVKKGGCGLVMPENKNGPRGPGPFTSLLLLMVPLALAVRLRRQFN